VASAAWERRNELARAEGFRNYYDKRTRRTPGAPKPSREELRRRRGHAGPTDLTRLLKTGRIELINFVQTSYTPATFDLLCTMKDGSQRSFTLRGERPVTRFRLTIDDLGADAPQLTGSPSGLSRLLEDEELDEELAAHEAELEEGEAGDEPAAFTDDDIPF
jgi:hypothetical protein